MEDSTRPSLLLELAARLDSITLIDLITPKDERPEGAEVLGYAPFSIQRIYTLYALITQECESSTLSREEAAAIDAATAAQQRRGVSEEELSQRYMAVRIAREKLCAYETTLDLLWTLMLAEAARIFPSEGYVHHLVTIYSDWSLAVMPDEEEESEEAEATAALMTAQPPPPDRYN